MRPLEQPRALLTGIRARGASGSAGWHSHPARRMAGKNSPFQTYKKEVCLPGHSMHPGPWAICCECQTRFGGRLPVPRVEAALPYWVPLSLRPRKQPVFWDLKLESSATVKNIHKNVSQSRSLTRVLQSGGVCDSHCFLRTESTPRIQPNYFSSGGTCPHLRVPGGGQPFPSVSSGTADPLDKGPKMVSAPVSVLCNHHRSF
ncbi:PREDICTED: uncharacterized protein C16orf95 homolog isoform X4 [Cercocebus atys]|uniref:uncharacterized protein C16orf95 homolog isoform X4 n=1 Tax=Cercocebus atys TaxID=9531 RepID=UPI0005F3FA27|nr:PREDICTED: uncharacterized protein C16orf95 homolog isoform X4 [Cercocebus atys]